MRKFLLFALGLLPIAGIGQALKPGILISEILFNPKPGGVDFVEIYNAGSIPADLSTMQIATVNSKDSVSSIKIISKNKILIQPGEYRVLTTRPESVQADFTCENPQWLLAVSSLPAYTNTKGTVLILSGKNVIDRLDYDEEMHQPLLKNQKGVSLERSSFSKPTNERSNWHSASSSVGYGTPTYRNSTAETGDNDELILASKTFSPDYDGFEDELILAYTFQQPDLLASISIFNLRGILVNRLRRNETLGTSGKISWNGLDENGASLPTGPYILVFEGFCPDGKTIRRKLACVLARKLN